MNRTGDEFTLAWPKRTPYEEQSSSAICDPRIGSGGGEGGREIVGVCLDQVGHRDRDLAVVFDEPFRVDDRDADDVAVVVQPNGVTLWGADGVGCGLLLASA